MPSGFVGVFVGVQGESGYQLIPPFTPPFYHDSSGIQYDCPTVMSWGYHTSTVVAPSGIGFVETP